MGYGVQNNITKCHMVEGGGLKSTKNVTYYLNGSLLDLKEN